MEIPAQLEIKPLGGVPHASIRVPGSKSITNRALVLAALSSNDTRIDGALRCEDTEVMIECLGRLGFTVIPEWHTNSIRVMRDGSQPTIPAVGADLFVGNSGTSMRFLTAIVALGHGGYRLDGTARMRERPIADLLDALRQLGVNAISENGDGCPPVVIESTGLPGGVVRVKSDISSQFASGLLMAAPFASEDVTVEIEGPLASLPYVQMTVTMMRAFRLRVYDETGNRFVVRAPRTCKPEFRYSVEPDATSASYFFAAAAITGGSVDVPRLTRSNLQGDLRFLDVLAKMGCEVFLTHCRDHESRGVKGNRLHGIDVDMNDISDTVMTLAAVACFADSPTTIRNVAHIRHKESDRITAMATELRRIGADVDERPDGLTITPRPLHGAVIQTYNDHRIAMSMAIIGLKVPGIVIDQPACVAKTYPRFFEDLEQLR